MADGPATQPSARPRSEAARPPDGWSIERLAAVDSTNGRLLAAARDGAPAGSVVVADHQRAGRGRRGRTWESAPGASLLVSVLLRPQLPVDRVHVVTVAAALALADAAQRVAGVRAALKWPNDLLVGERKLAGLLAEVDVTGGAVRALVVGAGCNLAQRSFPAAMADAATSCAIETGVAPDRDAMLEAFLAGFGARLDRLDVVVAEYRDRLATLHRDVRVELEDRVVEGTATGLDDAGRLVVVPHGAAPVVVAAGDVVHLRAT